MQIRSTKLRNQLVVYAAHNEVKETLGSTFIHMYLGKINISFTLDPSYNKSFNLQIKKCISDPK